MLRTNVILWIFVLSVSCNQTDQASNKSETLDENNQIATKHYIYALELQDSRPEKALEHIEKIIALVSSEQLDQYGFASEVAWRLLAIDYRKTLDDILKIPSDRQDVFFAELAPRIKQVTQSREIFANFLPDGIEIDDAVKLGTMTWVDDGKQEIETTLTIKGAPLGDKEK